MNVYVGSARAGHRVMESVTHFITSRFKLRVNEAKSAVARPQERQFQGFSFTGGRRLKRRIAPKAVQRFKRRVRQLTRRSRGVSLKQMVEQRRKAAPITGIRVRLLPPAVFCSLSTGTASGATLRPRGSRRRHVERGLS